MGFVMGAVDLNELLIELLGILRLTLLVIDNGQVEECLRSSFSLECLVQVINRRSSISFELIE